MRRNITKAISGALFLVVLGFWNSQVLALPRFITPPVLQGEATCRGERATLVVSAGETEMGTSERDVIVVLGPHAEVWTQQGDDLVCVYGPGANDRELYHGSRIYLGPGNNTVITYGGSNYIFASTGNDLIYLNGNYEDVEGHDGNDHIWALGATSATIAGEGGNDSIFGSPGSDTIDGGDDNDFIMGNSGNDFLQGAEGTDTLFGGFDQDTLDGGSGFGSDYCSDNDQDTSFVDCETVIQPPAPPFPEAG